ncbi:hypothetical protein [Methyloglobulus morosus]|uniref:hypothetical protein n=1 Tax=Methyloglobulus morosus TaxID=1410681 RepID=UPI0004180740|nr:hypothetical protein [Methyloglobulus morosus]
MTSGNLTPGTPPFTILGIAGGTYKGVAYLGMVIGSKLPPGNAAQAVLTIHGVISIRPIPLSTIVGVSLVKSAFTAALFCCVIFDILDTSLPIG